MRKSSPRTSRSFAGVAKCHSPQAKPLNVCTLQNSAGGCGGWLASLSALYMYGGIFALTRMKVEVTPRTPRKSLYPTTNVELNLRGVVEIIPRTDPRTPRSDQQFTATRPWDCGL